MENRQRPTKFVTISKGKPANNQCFGNFMGEFSVFLIDKDRIKNVHKLIISFKGDAEKFILHFMNVFQMQKFFRLRFKQTCLIVVGI